MSIVVSHWFHGQFNQCVCAPGAVPVVGLVVATPRPYQTIPPHLFSSLVYGWCNTLDLSPRVCVSTVELKRKAEMTSVTVGQTGGGGWQWNTYK